MIAVTACVPSRECFTFEFRCDWPIGQCIGIQIKTELGRDLLVQSIRVAGVEQLLGEGVPTSLLALAPLQLDRQCLGALLLVTLRNEYAIDTVAEVTTEFVPVQSLELTAKGFN